MVTQINISDIYPGGFYFLHYMDDSNWIRYSPVFIAEFKKYNITDSKLITTSLVKNYLKKLKLLKLQ
jgi:hypothetical protein